jgi:hypothetical protein
LPPASTPIRRTRSPCCARATSGQAARLQHLSQILQVPVPFFFEGAPASIGRPGAEESADDPSPSFVSDFLATSEGLDLVRAFTCIEDAKLRRSIVRLVEEIAPEAV